MSFTHLLTKPPQFRIEVDKILTLVRRCIGSEMKTDLCYRLDTLVSSINFHIGEGNYIVTKKDASERHIRDQLREIADRITELLFGKEGVRVALNLFETNIKSVTWAILQQHEESLLSKKISIERSFPEGSCIVYGEDTDYKLILHNLVENVWKWSNGSKLFVKGTIDESERYVILEVLDNGVGIKDKMSIGVGLRNVKSIVSRYYGEFDLRSVNKTRLRDEGWTISATIKLPYLRPVEEEKQ